MFLFADQVPTVRLCLQSHLPYYAHQHHVVSLLFKDLRGFPLSGMERIFPAGVLGSSQVSYRSPPRNWSLGFSPTSSRSPLSPFLCSSSSTQESGSSARTDWFRLFSPTKPKTTWRARWKMARAHALNLEDHLHRDNQQALCQYLLPFQMTPSLRNMRLAARGTSVCPGSALTWLGSFALPQYLCRHSLSGRTACLLETTRLIDGWPPSLSLWCPASLLSSQ